MIRLTEFEGRIEAMQEFKQSLYEAIKNIEPTPVSDQQSDSQSQAIEPPSGPELSSPVEGTCQDEVNEESTQPLEEPVQNLELTKEDLYEETISLPSLSNTIGMSKLNQ